MVQQLDSTELLMKPVAAPTDMTSSAWTERKAALASGLRAHLIAMRLCASTQLNGVPDDAVIRAYATAARWLGSPTSERSLSRFVRDARNADEFRVLLVRPVAAIDVWLGAGAPRSGRGRHRWS